MVGEVGLPRAVQAGDGRHQLVVDPEPAHRVVRRRVDPHRRAVRVLAGDPLVHLEQVPVALPHDVLAEAADGVGEVEVDAVLERADAAAGVDRPLGRPRRDVARGQVAEARVQPLEVVVALVLGDLVGHPLVTGDLGHPHPAVVAQRLRHQRQLGLGVVGLRDARRVDLGVARVGEVGALAVGPPRRRHVARHGVGRQEEGVAVPARAQDHGVGAVRADLAGQQVASTRCRRSDRRRRRRRRAPCGSRALMLPRPTWRAICW